MTLIDYLNRVHFADNILEDALWAELEERGPKAILVISDDEHLGGEPGERFRAGLPKSTRVIERMASPGPPRERDARSLAAVYGAEGCEVLIAFGPGTVIDLAKLVRLSTVGPRHLADYSITEGGAFRSLPDLPDMIAVPTLKGFASGFNGSARALLDDGGMVDIASRDLVPTVTICDPTLVASEPAEIQASAGVSAITRCIEALLSPNYNPPADGIALDGLSRALGSIQSATGTGELAARREMMAASMNAAMVRKKGLGLAHAIGSALDTVTAGTLDPGAVARLLLPEILKYYAATNSFDSARLNSVFGVEDSRAVAGRLSALFDTLPLPNSFRELGVGDDALTRAAPLAARHRSLSNGPSHPGSSEILSILQAVE